MRRADSWRRLAEGLRGLPGSFGLREHSVEIVLSARVGGRTAVGDRIEAFRKTIIVGGYNPKVKFPSQKDLASGMLSMGQILIGPITPEFLDELGEHAGGTTVSLLDRTKILISNTLHLIVTGPSHPSGAKYTIENINAEKAIRFTITCNAVASNG